MATLREFFDTDFSHTVKLHAKFPTEELADIQAVILFDFSGHMAFFACYVQGADRPLDFFLRLLKALDYGRTQFQLDGKITLPSARTFPGALRVGNTNPLEVLARFHGDVDWLSIHDIQSSRRVFIYSETSLKEADLRSLKSVAKDEGHHLQFRSIEHAAERSRHERPLAFICHDSRDKKEIARRIALGLQRMMCPTWYDEFSLKVGDNLRDKIEKGLKECRKCIVILSPNFFSNGGWTKKEFDSVFTREILEQKNLVLPVWYGVGKQEVYDYSPSLLNIKGVDRTQLGEEEVCRQVCRAILNDNEQ
jgi:hypothetical protein